MDSGTNLKDTIDKFQHSVQQVSSDIKNAEVDWNDEKNRGLALVISEVAQSSRRTLSAYESFSNAVRRFYEFYKE